jgi:large subunit ribosomal protein L22
MGLVVDSIRGKEVTEALNLLKFQSKASSPLVEKLLMSAIANWENKNDASVDEVELFVTEVYVTQGKTLKRFRPAPQGRAHRIRKRSNHVTLVVDTVEQYGTYGDDDTEDNYVEPIEETNTNQE